jgi:hypothetical protein
VTGDDQRSTLQAYLGRDATPTTIAVRLRGVPAGTAIPHRIGRHAHLKTRPETPVGARYSVHGLTCSFAGIPGLGMIRRWR